MKIYNVILLIILLSIEISIACGPHFPPYLFTFREQVMKSLPDQIFSEEMTRVIKPECAVLIEQAPQGGEGTILEEQKWVDSIFHPLLTTARRANSLNECKDIVTPLPHNLQLYIQGAWFFGQWSSPSFKLDAIEMFDSLIALDNTDMEPLTVRAHFMKGQTYKHLHFGDSAIVSFQRTRELIIKGAPDNLGLGNSSYTIEADIHWDRGDVDRALHLMALQRAGSSMNDNSQLRVRTRAVLKDNSLFQIALKDTIAQRVLASYIANIYSANWVIMDDSSNVLNMERLIDIAVKNPESVDQDALDNFAAALYRAGNFELAKKLIANGNSISSNLIRANFAIRNGELGRADQYFNLVLEEWPQFYFNRDYIYFMVANGNFEDAFIALCKSSGEIRDIEYIAERLFTVEQLLSMVEENSDLLEPFLLELYPLIGRRLMREGKTLEALDYFLTDKEISQQYHNASISAKNSLGIERATHLYAMVNLLRESGMEIIGFELGPDWSSLDGVYSLKFPYQYEDGFASAREYRMLKETASHYEYRLHYRYYAAELALEAANLLPENSQQYDAVIWAGQRALGHDLIDPRKSVLGNYRSRYGSGEPRFDALEMIDQ